MKRLAIITTHPIQYNAPLFKLLAQRKNIEIKVFYTWGESVLKKKYDPGFGKVIDWDIPLLEGYNYEFLENTAKDQGSHHFRGIINPHIITKISAFKPDALLAFGWSFVSHLKCLRFFHNKIPVFFKGDSTLLNETKGIKKIMRMLFLTWVFKHVDFAFYVGSNNKLYLKQHGLKENQLILGLHAIDNERFAEPESEYNIRAATWKRELGILPEELTVLYAGKLEEVKNVEYIINLAQKVRELPVKFIIVGNGVLEKQIKHMALGNKNIIFLDFQNQGNMPVVYRLGDIFILASKSETWGLGANEAMACGCALMLSSNVGGAIDLIEEEKNGIIFNSNDIQKSVFFIKKMVDNKNELKNMKEYSRKKINDFSFSAIASAIEDVLKVN